MGAFTPGANREQAKGLRHCKKPNSERFWKYQSDIDNHVIKNEHDITNVSGLVGDNASTQNTS